MGKNKKTIILPLLILAVFLAGVSWQAARKNSIENKLFSTWFADAPEKTQATGIAPSLAERGGEIISASQAAGLLTPVLPTADAEGQLYQRTAYLPIEADRQCRCTYYIYVEGGEVKSFWIEAAYVEDGRVPASPCQIFSAKTSQSDMISYFAEKCAPMAR